jgi:transaldolase
MAETYFARAQTATGMRFWVNNPTDTELDLAIVRGAAGCTTNPAYGGNLLRRAPDEIQPIVTACMGEGGDDPAVASRVQQRLVERIAARFRPLHQRSDGRLGFVSIQGAPEADTDPEVILEEAHNGRAIGPNVAPKIPATAAGLEAMGRLVAEGSPIIVTEVFSVAQVVEVCERWLAAAGSTRPPFFMSPITGIFGDHLKRLAAAEQRVISAGDMEMAGVLLARRCYRLVVERGYPVTLLYGGARTQLDFAGLVGGGMAATINWSTAAELLERDPPVHASITDPVDPAVEARLVEAFSDVRRALALDGLTPAEFGDFGPVQHFRNSFISGWRAVLDAIAAARADDLVNGH